MNELLDSPEFQLVRAGDPAADTPATAPDGALRARILALPQRSRRRRRPLIIGTGTTIGIAALAGAAAAAGLIPSGVTHAFRSLGGSGNGVHDAHVVAEAEAPSGIKVQVWVGHNANGGSCEYTRVVGPTGAEDGGRSCFSASGMEAPPDAFDGGLEAAGRPLPPLTYIVTARTTLPNVARIALVFDDRTAVPLAYNASTGYAVGVVTPDRTMHTSELLAYDSSGRVVARVRQPATTGAGSG
jgi:hypothetical protein